MLSPKVLLGVVASAAGGVWAKAAAWAAARYLYLHGPAVLGGWEGQPLTDVCARLTNTEAAMWEYNVDECHALVERKVTALLIGVGAVTGVLLVYQFASFVVSCAMLRTCCLPRGCPPLAAS